MAERSYVMPSEPITGSFITSWVMGHRKWSLADIVLVFIVELDIVLFVGFVPGQGQLFQAYMITWSEELKL
jgi:hypothetical protein